MATVKKVLYPSPDNYQNANSSEVPLQWAIAYLQDLQKRIPTTERDTANVGGWSQLQVSYTHSQSEQEVRNEQLQALTNLLKNASRDGLTYDQIQAAILAIGI